MHLLPRPDIRLFSFWVNETSGNWLKLGKSLIETDGGGGVGSDARGEGVDVRFEGESRWRG
jgi:hypothetical protein